MALSTAFGSTTLVLSADDTLVFGTCMLGTTFGQVKSASLKRAADRALIANCLGNLRAVLLKNPRFDLVLKTLFDEAITAPGLIDTVSFPLAGVTGRILDISVDWEEGARMLSIEATDWDCLSGAAAFQTEDGSMYEPLDLIGLNSGNGIGLNSGGGLGLNG